MMFCTFTYLTTQNVPLAFKQQCVPHSLHKTVMSARVLIQHTASHTHAHTFTWH